MATNTYVALATQTVGSAVSSVTFSSIPQGYTDLVLVMKGDLTGTGAVYVQFNGDTASNYSSTYIQGQSGTASSGRDSALYLFGLLTQYYGPNVGIANIMNYSNSTTYKTVLSRANDTATVNANVGLWRGTPAAITSLTLKTSANNFAVGSTFTIYGIAAAPATAYATGGTIYSDSTYFYHVFGSTGTFTPTQALSNVDYLVVAGGGGGKPKIGGGGGAGGYRTTVGTSGGGASAESKISLNSGTAYTITVGAGGTSNANGSDSAISGTGLTTITSLGGGYGGYSSGSTGYNPASGGSGGGGAGPELSSGTMTGGAGTTGQGYAGADGKSGSSSPTGWHMGAGGGGAGGAAPAITLTSGAGGPGITSPIDNVTRAGGGGAGSQYGDANWGKGGAGGGGRGGGYFINPTNGEPNTGGGGGGGGYGGSADSATSQGGSGIVIIRYPK